VSEEGEQGFVCTSAQKTLMSYTKVPHTSTAIKSCSYLDTFLKCAMFCWLKERWLLSHELISAEYFISKKDGNWGTLSCSLSSLLDYLSSCLILKIRHDKKSIKAV